MARPNPSPNSLGESPGRNLLLSALAAVGLWTSVDVLAPRSPVGPCPGASESSARQLGGEFVSERVRCDGRGEGLRGPARLLFGERLDLNRAGPLTLQVLPGIGPARAAAIVSGREQAPYLEVEELLRVRGIGPKSLARAAPYLMVGSLGGESGIETLR